MKCNQSAAGTCHVYNPPCRPSPRRVRPTYYIVRSATRLLHGTYTYSSKYTISYHDNEQESGVLCPPSRQNIHGGGWTPGKSISTLNSSRLSGSATPCKQKWLPRSHIHFSHCREFLFNLKTNQVKNNYSNYYWLTILYSEYIMC